MIKFPGCQVKEQIYETENSSIYRAIQNNDNNPVIIKLLNKDYPRQGELAHFRHEYEMTHRLTGDGIIEAYSLEKYNSSLAMILEDFGGQSLSQMPSLKHLELSEKIQLAIKITDALSQVHGQNIIHKDINPSNIVWNLDTKQVKIIDFGISTELSRENPEVRNPNVLEGTLNYISPEQTGRMNRAMDYRTDMYSLGVTFYEIFTGQLPFSGVDAMEMVHSHIAKTPTPPKKIVLELPAVISDIVMKLLSKTAEERYQNTYGLKSDLEYCLEQLKSKRTIDVYKIGQNDVSDRFQIPQKLYGRDSEVETLLASFDRISQGTKEIMLVAGYPGIGKTVLVNEVTRPIAEKRGNFISGKFDQYKRNIPYLAFIQAFQNLVKHLLAETEEELFIWKEKLMEALGHSGQVVIDVIPEVELIIGKQPPVQELDPDQTRNRFNIVFQKFVRVFGGKENPLVIFIDDLQWADLSSIQLIELIMKDIDTSYIMIIGAYRNNEMSVSHPLLTKLEEMRKAGCAINTIFLKPLEINSVNQLVSDTLLCDPNNAYLLAELCTQKTLGNPFFLNQLLYFLYEENLIDFNVSDAHWEYDLVKINKVDITDNVVELMVGKIQKLSKETQDILKLASCIGNQFDLDTLNLISKELINDIAKTLIEVSKERLIIPIDDSCQLTLGSDQILNVNYRFLHSRIKQAAYSLIPEDEKKKMHFTIGWHLLANSDDNSLKKEILNIVNHCNVSLNLLQSDEEKIKIVDLNLMAANKAKKSAAYESSLHYAYTGIDLIKNIDKNEKNRWKKHYHLLASLYLESIEATFLLHKYEEMDKLALEILKHTNEISHKARVIIMQIYALSAQDKLKESVDFTLQSLKKIGTRIPFKPGRIGFLLKLLLVKIKLFGWDKEKLMALPDLEEPGYKAITDIIICNCPPMYLTRPNLMVYYIQNIVSPGLKYGLSTGFQYALISFGFINIYIGSIEAGYRYARMAIEAMEARSNLEYSASNNFVYNMFVRHWKEDVRSTIKSFTEIYQYAIENGDIEWSSVSIVGLCLHTFYAGTPLDETLEVIEKHKKILLNHQHQTSLNFVNVIHQAVLNLQGNGKEKIRFLGPIFNEESGPKLFAHFFMQMMLAYLFEDYEVASEMSKKARKKMFAVQGMVYVVMYTYYDTLIQCQLVESSPKNKKKHLKFINKNLKKMKKWAKHAPMNNLHKLHLLEAEKARIMGENEKARELYKNAINEANINEYMQEEALAYELYAKFLFNACGEHDVANLYMKKACYCYSMWGATAKVSHLKETYPQLLKESTINTMSGSLRMVRGTGESTTSDVLDLSTIMKASNSISREIVLPDLLEQLMNVSMENAGAERGYMMLVEDGSLYVEAEAITGKEDITVLQSIPIDKHPGIPHAIINYVARTRKTLILNNASIMGDYTNDPYIIKNRSKSILCVPILSRGEVSGILYLENNLSEYAFTPERLEVLKMISSQAAISIENSLLYQNLEEKINERTEQLKVANKNLLKKSLEITIAQDKVKEKDRHKSKFLANMSHELRTPLNSINGIAELLRFGTYEKEDELIHEIGDMICSINDILEKNKNDDLSLMVSNLKSMMDFVIKEGNLKSYLFQKVKGELEENGFLKSHDNLNNHIERILDIIDTEEKDKFNAYKRIKESGDYLLGLINTVLNLSKIEAGKIEVVKKEALVKEIVESVMVTAENYKKSKKKDGLIELNYFIDDSIPEKMTLDNQKTKQVLLNYLSNGIKFTDKGDVTLSVQKLNGSIRFSVRDSGLGIKNKDRHRIFSEFERTEEVSNIEGTGLGLAISKRLIELQGGTCGFESELGKGSEFWFELPG